MENTNKTSNGEYKLYSYILIIISLFLVLFFTRTQIYDLKVNSNSLKEINSEIQKAQGELDDIMSIKESINNGTIDKSQLDKFLITYNENEIIDFFYTQADKKNIGIVSITLGNPTLDEFGFKEATININAEFTSQQQLLDYITYINSSDKYNFYTHSLSFDYGMNTEILKVTIPVTILYK